MDKLLYFIDKENIKSVKIMRETEDEFILTQNRRVSKKTMVFVGCRLFLTQKEATEHLITHLNTKISEAKKEIEHLEKVLFFLKI